MYLFRDFREAHCPIEPPEPREVVPGLGECYWSLETIPMFRQSLQNITFVMHFTNPLDREFSNRTFVLLKRNIWALGKPLKTHDCGTSWWKNFQVGGFIEVSTAIPSLFLHMRSTCCCRLCQKNTILCLNGDNEMCNHSRLLLILRHNKGHSNYLIISIWLSSNLCLLFSSCSSPSTLVLFCGCHCLFCTHRHTVLVK